MPGLMSAFESSGGMAFLGNAILGVTGIAAWTILIVFWLRHRPARVRQSLLVGGLFGLLVAPMLTLVWTGLGIGGLRRSADLHAAAAQVDTGAGTAPLAVPTPPVQTGSSRVPGGAAADPDPLPKSITDADLTGDLLSWAVLLWALGTGVAGLRFAAGHLVLWRLRRCLPVLSDPRVRTSARRAARLLRIEPPGLRTSPRIAAPFSFGIWRPLIVFPQGTADLDAGALDGVMIHEMAHIAEDHHRIRWPQHLVVALFWWHPLVLVLDRWLRRIQEDVCDDRVVAALGRGDDLARCLLTFAEHAHSADRRALVLGAIGSKPGGGELERRIRNLLREDRPTMDHKPLRRITGLVLFLALAGTTHAGLTIQDKPSRIDNSPAAFFPLAKDATWTWRFQQQPDGKPVEKTLRCIRQVQAKDQPCWELRSVQGRSVGWEYWAAPTAGIFRFPTRFIRSMRGVSDRDAPTRLIPGPIGAETRWTWQEQGSVQLSGEDEGPSKETLRRHFEGRIESMSEKVVVPAGTFDAIRVRITMRSDFFGTSIDTLWLARGVGLVKRVVTNPKSQRSNHLELIAYKPGTETTVSAEAQIRSLLATPALAGKGKPDSITKLLRAELEASVSSRFFTARWNRDGAEELLVFRHDGATTRIFRPDQQASWDAIVAETTPFGRDEARGLARAYGMILAATSGLTGIRVRGTDIQVRANDDFDVRVHVHAVDGKGEPVVHSPRVAFRGGKIVAIQKDAPR